MARWSTHLDALMADRYPALLAYANMLASGNRAAAEDIVQDAIVRVFSKHRRFDSVAHAERYTRRAILTVFLDQSRSRRRLTTAFTKLAQPDEIPAAEGAIAATDEMHTLLASLTPRQRACVVLRFYDDLSLAEIASQLGIAVGSVKRYLHDATSSLGNALGDADLNAERIPVSTRKAN